MRNRVRPVGWLLDPHEHSTSTLTNSNACRVVLQAAALLTVILLAGGWLLPAAEADDQTTSREKSDVWALGMALRSYKEEYGNYPQGDQAAILRALCGRNLRQIVYFEQEDQFFNGKGELFDSWGTPYKIELDAKPQPHISSAGKNKVFDGDANGSDDICSWR